MATSGASARDWLQQNGEKTPTDRLEQILASLHKKMENLDEADPLFQGILDAIDVMDQYIAQRQQPASAQPLATESAPEANLDLSHLGDPVSEDIQALHGQQKHDAFSALKQQFGQTPGKPD